MADNNNFFKDILSKADPKTINAIKQMAKSGQLDDLKSKLGNMNKNELINSLKSFDKNSIENVLNKLNVKDIKNNPAIKQVVDDISTNKNLQNDIKSMFKDKK